MIVVHLLFFYFFALLQHYLVHKNCLVAVKIHTVVGVRENENISSLISCYIQGSWIWVIVKDWFIVVQRKEDCIVEIVKTDLQCSLVVLIKFKGFVGPSGEGIKFEG